MENKKITKSKFAKELVHLIDMGFTYGKVGELFRVAINRIYPAQIHLAGKNKKINDNLKNVEYISKELKDRLDKGEEFFIGEISQDHVVPICEILKFWEENKNNLTDNFVENSLRKALHVCIITKEENAKLNAAKLARRMPENWNWNKDDIFTRYEKVGIKAMKNPNYKEPSVQN